MDYKPGRRMRIIVLLDKDLIPPESLKGLSEKESQSLMNEYDVITTLKEMGHEVIPVGLKDDVGVIRDAIAEHKPQIAFNLLVEFHGHSLFEPHIVSYLELRKQPYTGCNPRGLLLARDKALTKNILAFHRIRFPLFALFPVGKKVNRPKKLSFPLMVKSVIEDGSVAISQASVVYDDAALTERVKMVHGQTGTHAIAEEYIDGREIYVAVIGNQRLQTFTPWELFLKNLPQGAPYVATSKIKWNRIYQEKVGLTTEPASLTAEQKLELERLSKRIYRLLNLSGYARMDFRLREDGRLFLLEANPNPDISRNEDFAQAAKHCDVGYRKLLQRILNLGLAHQPFFNY